MNLFTTNTKEIFPQAMPGIVEEAIATNQPGRVKFKTTYWPAILFEEKSISLAPGQKIAVVGRIGITLLISPL
ncbi:NfeD family protein [Dapis sp. BLCC M229]|uniref:NfeD family protein n=1 Tax=Dapis sp. BLCC M229 TaxID=3400188 RepID=UPI003CF61427